MIAALLAAAALSAAPQPAPQSAPTPQILGRSSVYAGMCASIGWVSSEEQVVAEAQAYIDAHPEQTDAQVQVLMGEGIDAAKAEIDAMLEAYRTSRDADAMKATVRKECDALARDFPAFLSRAADTDAQFEARMTAFLGGG